MTALIFGGAASGKSAYAEDLICRLPRRGPLVYLASMDPLSGGGERIRRHRALRAGKGFVTVERPRGLAGCPLPAGSAVLLEDLDNLAANELFTPQFTSPDLAFARIFEGLQQARRRADHLVAVGGDLYRDGADYPPETAAYLDLTARLLRAMAAQADLVVEVVCGLPVVWKGAAV